MPHGGLEKLDQPLSEPMESHEGVGLRRFPEVSWSEFDFIDFGCSNGGSLLYCMKRFGATRGLGIDLEEIKVTKTLELGLDAIHANVFDLPANATVRFVAMMDFLEHLPSVAEVGKAIAVAARVAKDFLYIRHPSFEGEAYLSELGLVQYWWNWSGHTSHIRISDYCKLFEELGLTQYCVHYRERVVNSSHPCILPANTPRNLHLYDPERDPPKTFVEFDESLWRAQDIFVALRAFDFGEWSRIVGTRNAVTD